MQISDNFQQHMVVGQLEPNRILSPHIVDAMARLRREAFVPEALRLSACVDEELEVASGRFLASPMIAGKMLEAAQPLSTDRALVLGSPTGYLAALLSSLVKHVVTVEVDSMLAEETRGRLRQLRLNNVDVITAPWERGGEAHGPYSLIVVEGAVREFPEAWFAQLGDGGRLVGVRFVHGSPTSLSGLGRLCLVEKRQGAVSIRELAEANMPLLPGFAGHETFVF